MGLGFSRPTFLMIAIGILLACLPETRSVIAGPLLELPRNATPRQESGSNPTSIAETLRSQPINQLAKKVLALGDPARGALIYFNPELTCVRCHEPSKDDQVRLGPAIAEINSDASVEFLIESILDPSREITEGFQTDTILTADGKQVSGLVVAEDPSEAGFVILADPERDGRQIRIENSDIDGRATSKVSAMPLGLVGAIKDEQSFFDLIRYLFEIKKGGIRSQLQLRPPESFFAVAPLPAYESNINHQGMIESLNKNSFQRGEAIYQRFCARCHGTQEQQGSIPSALRFSEGVFKNGNDPQSLYQTLTHGYGLMVAQRWMVPKQKYDVIHYIREKFLKLDNPKQHTPITSDYLASLPKGSEFGPDPVASSPWSEMDYGNFLFNTYEVGDDGSNIAYKGIAVRLDQGPGGVSHGKHWVLYEHDTMRIAAVWSGMEFIDYNGIHFNDQHNIHPQVVGDIHFSNDHRPGWANPVSRSFDNDPRVIGRDNKRYGPLPESWLKYRGIYQHGDRVVLNYTVGQTAVLESPSLQYFDDLPVFHRALNIAPRDQPLTVKVASVEGLIRDDNVKGSAALFLAEVDSKPVGSHEFDGTGFLTTQSPFDWDNDLTIAARIRTRDGGTILCQTADQPLWVAGGTSLFVRGGRLVFDIGWIGDVSSKQTVDDGQWHDVALVWKPHDKSVQLYIDGQLDKQGVLECGDEYENPVVRIGYTASNFPDPSLFQGDISYVKVWDQALDTDAIALMKIDRHDDLAVAEWNIDINTKVNETVTDSSSNENHARWVSANQISRVQKMNTWAVAAGLSQARWSVIDDSLCLQIPAGDQPLNLGIFIGSSVDQQQSQMAIERVTHQTAASTATDLSNMVRGGPSRYPDSLTSRIETMPVADTSPFEVDFLNHPDENPWSCRMRLTGIDFLNENQAVICAWDGSVWELTGFRRDKKLTWRRIANGLFQPLGIRFVRGEIFVTCRDQLVRLVDLNHDGFIDYYDAFNSDHQVTEHFHEFAMGLQTDDDGNFYYAKSARHALPALVPHHGTLLKIDSDGGGTQILANGFRAANGVCLNPDGTFFVTDQEGHWTPKNRINWVKGEQGFFGNMLGYHDVVDKSDNAMQQPVCWITNEFDRSPGELMWVPRQYWGPLGGSLLNLSYGMGQIFVVPHENVEYGDQRGMQGGMCALPIPLFPTGVMRGRFHSDGHLYCCGMYAWAGNQQKPGGLYRIRHTGKPSWLPKSLVVSDSKISITFSDDLDESAIETDRYVVRVWDIRRSANYGSKHLDEQELVVDSAQLKPDRKTVELTIPGLSAIRCMEIKCLVRTPDGREVTRVIHNTIHSTGNQSSNDGSSVD